MSLETSLPLSAKKIIATKMACTPQDIVETLLRDSKGGSCSDSCVYALQNTIIGTRQIYKVLSSYFVPYLSKYIDIQNTLPEYVHFEFNEDDIQTLSVMDTRIIDEYEHGLPRFGLTCNWELQSHTVTKFVTRILHLPNSENITIDPCTGDLLYGPIPFIQGETIQDLYDIPGNWTFIDYYLKKIQHVITQQSGVQFRPDDEILGAVGMNHKLEKIEGNTVYTTITDVGDSIEMLVKLNP